jgi:hypothetical protein
MHGANVYYLLMGANESYLCMGANAYYFGTMLLYADYNTVPCWNPMQRDAQLLDISRYSFPAKGEKKIQKKTLYTASVEVWIDARWS